MSHGLKAAEREVRLHPDRCPQVFVPHKQDKGLNYRRTCLCGERRGHKGPHCCPDCGGTWGIDGPP